jgi:ATP-dependent DNA helicase RecQ
MPSCPQCGSNMVLRTARRGSNAGNRFYGCSNYPRCKGTLPFNAQVNLHDAASNVPKARPQIDLADQPRAFNARALLENQHAVFYDCVCCDLRTLTKIHQIALPDHYLNAYSQWRIDYQGDKGTDLNPRMRQILSVIEKILTRGRITLCSPKLEEQFVNLFHVNAVTEIDVHDLPFLAPTPQIPTNLWFDDNSELDFYKNVCPRVLGSRFAQWVTPQVDLASLAINANIADSKQRVDFVINYPGIRVPLVVEIDGAQHIEHHDIDAQRDAALRNNGYEVLRIKSRQLDQAMDEVINNVSQMLELERYPIHDAHVNNLHTYLATLRCAHKMQLTLLHALKIGRVTIGVSNPIAVTTDLEKHLGLIDSVGNEAKTFILEDMNELVTRVANVYGLKVNQPIFILQEYSQNAMDYKDNHITIKFDANEILAVDKSPTSSIFSVRDICVPCLIATQGLVSAPSRLLDPDPEMIKYFLRYIYRKRDFWEGQFEAIARAVQGEDSIVLLPTGGGKSIAFQLASFLLPGCGITIEPIISLIDDQIENMAELGIDRTIGISSQLPEEAISRILNLVGMGQYIFVYVAPERFQIAEFRESLRSLTVHTPVSLVAIDECHCVSEWGHDFRPAYLNIGRTARQYCTTGRHTPPVMALTGTASKAVLKDVQRELQIQDFDAIITPKSFDRKELTFHVMHCRSDEKRARLKGLLGHRIPDLLGVPTSEVFRPAGTATQSGLVFCPHVNGEHGTTQISHELEADLGIPVTHYSGGPPKGVESGEWNSIKRNAAKKFKHNNVPLMVATKGFGMGIDKPNIRYTVHYGLPASIESFYQEAGRAGRDKKSSQCVVLVSNDNVTRTRQLVNPNTKVEEIAKIIQDTSWVDNDDITRALYFHTKAFLGVKTELEDIAKVCACLPDLNKELSRDITVGTLDRVRVEKALHRLVILGIIKDYTVKYGSAEFHVWQSGASQTDIVEAYCRYVGGYIGARVDAERSKATALVGVPYLEFVIRIAAVLLQFIYDKIERGRRRSLNEMLLAATQDIESEAFRHRILRYLEATEYSESMEAIIASSDIGLDKAIAVFEKVVSPNDAAELRGQASRYLESYPDHPCLLMLRALSEMYAKDRVTAITEENYYASLISAKDAYSVAPKILTELIIWALSAISKRDPSFVNQLASKTLTICPDSELARAMVRTLPPKAAWRPAWFLLGRLGKELDKLLPNEGIHHESRKPTLH